MSFRVGLTRDFFNPRGELGFGDIGLALLDDAGVEWEPLDDHGRELSAGDVAGYDALLVLSPRITAATLTDAERLAVLARFGVGYDSVDVDACTEHGVALTITPDGVRRPVAVAAIAYVLALAHRMPQRDALTRAGGWADRMDDLGTGLIDRTLGLLGLGNIGAEVARLAAPFGMRHLATDPQVDDDHAASVAAELVDLDTLFTESDFVVITAALTAETRGLVDGRLLELMKPSAYLVNVARGPIVDQAALTEALAQRRIRGAGIDVFEEEPVDPDDPLLAQDNVIVSPHAICFTDQMALGNGRSALAGMLEVAAGRPPQHVVNGAVLERPAFVAKLERYAGLPA
jgi:phosphoglycerate dehydrogenase-like enzyme